MRVVLIVSLVLVAASAAHGAPDGTPVRPRNIGRWLAHHPVRPQPNQEPWTPADVAGFLAMYPGTYIDVGEEGKSPGGTQWQEWSQRIAALRTEAARQSVDLNARVCLSERPDVLTRLMSNVQHCAPSAGGGGCDWEGDMDGSLGEAETVVKVAGRATDGSQNALVDTTQNWEPELYRHRLLVLRPGGAGSETRRVVSNNEKMLIADAVWDVPPQPGDRYEVRGSFDPAWVKRIPLATHQATVQRFWTNARNVCGAGAAPCRAPAQPLDPFSPANVRGWASWFDRKAIESLRTATEVPVLYGNTADAGSDPLRHEDPYYEASAVVVDLANPAYRAWRARYLLYYLADFGFPPAANQCLLVAYKPGLHTFHDESVNGPNTMDCSEPGTNTWLGPAHVCRDGTLWGGPFEPTPFRAGEYEAAVSAYFREMLATLTAAGYTNLRVITVEAPPYGQNWRILADDVRRDPRMYGEHFGSVEPALALLRSAEPPPAADGATQLGAGTDLPEPIPGAAETETGTARGTASGSAGPTEAAGARSATGSSGPSENAGAITTGSRRPAALAPVGGSTPRARSSPARRGHVAGGGRGRGGAIEAPTEP